jgi:hypothetical protein
MVQALTLGRIVDDAGTSHLDNELWARAAYAIFGRSMLSTDG